VLTQKQEHTSRGGQGFEVLPAIDVLEGRVVRLSQGRREAVTIEGGDPVELARRFRAEGARRLHLVDLDGAFSGTPTLDLVGRVATAGGLPLQVGGGYRSHESIAAALAAGADRVMVGTAALSPTFLAEAARRYGDGLVVAIDVRDGEVAVDGWTRGSGTTAAGLAAGCASAGVRRLLVTSTARDGSLAGPDLGLIAEVLRAGLPVIAAGGISSIYDLLRLRELGCEGAVAGSALLAGRFTLSEALERLEV
jgi:phosphoribosylformimino-5-aminoimidazole carboxamide ribotide isomerase